jgi:hypothetical protein
MIWRRRFVDRKPPPWTADKVLAANRFTNVYRELDPGTVYAIEGILENDGPKPDKVFNIMIYRLIGRSDTHRALGFQRLGSFNPDRMAAKLQEIRKGGGHPFTGAYMVGGYTKMGSKDKGVNIARLFAALAENFSPFYSELSGCKSMEEAYVLVKSLYGFGNFLAYQVLVDITYPLKAYGGRPLLDVPQEAWAAAGPGAKKGIGILAPDKMGLDLEVMKWLRDNQTGEFARLGLDFPNLSGEDGKRRLISLPNIQNCLCEYHKYVKIMEGTGRARRTYRYA